MLTILLGVLLPCLQSPADGRRVELFNGRDLSGWTALGDARYTAQDGAILGRTGGGGHSFLVTERTFGDFVLELDVKTEEPGNSGIQIRSHVSEKGRMVGYQVEIDPSPRAWSGGLYDEGRRGWLQNLEGRDEARAAFRHGAWNRYRIECRGTWIRTWVNDVPITDHLDPLDVEGVIGLQVHSGQNTRVRWGHVALLDLGTRTWSAAAPSEPSSELAVRWTHDPAHPTHRADPAVLHFPLAAGQAWDARGGELLAPGLTLRAGVWTLDVADLALDAGDGPRRVAVCSAAGRVSVFVDGARVSDADTQAAGRGLALLENAEGAEFLGPPRRR